MISLVNLHTFNPDDYDVTYAIVRSYQHKSNDLCVFQLKELAPSSELFLQYTSLKNNGQWNKASFDSIYVPKYIYDLVHNIDALRKLDFVCRMSSSGVNMGVGCYCYDESTCHRSVVGGILQGCGAEVFGAQNLLYYEMYIEALRNK